MDQSALLELAKTLGQAGIFAYAAYKFYQDGRASDKVWTQHLLDQNKILLSYIMQRNFLGSPAIAPIAPTTRPSWMENIPTDLGDAKTA